MNAQNPKGPPRVDRSFGLPPPLPRDLSAFGPGQIFVPGSDGTSGPLFMLGKLGVGGAACVYRCLPVASVARSPGQTRGIEVPAVPGIYPGLTAQEANALAASSDPEEQRVLKVLRFSPGDGTYEHARGSMDFEVATHQRVFQAGGGINSFPRFFAHGFSPRRHLVLEYVRGIPFSEYLWGNPQDHRHTAGFLRWDCVLGFWLQFLSAVSYLHEMDILHRDLKPENIIMRKDRKTRVRSPVVLDFGGAKDLQNVEQVRRGLTIIHGLFGTPKYLAPEQVARQPATKATDIFALGRLLFETVSIGEPLAQLVSWEAIMQAFDQPLAPCAHPELNESQRVAIAALYRWMCAKDPLMRPASVDAVRRSLAAISRMRG